MKLQVYNISSPVLVRQWWTLWIFSALNGELQCLLDRVHLPLITFLLGWHGRTSHTKQHETSHHLTSATCGKPPLSGGKTHKLKKFNNKKFAKNPLKKTCKCSTHLKYKSTGTKKLHVSLHHTWSSYLGPVEGVDPEIWEHWERGDGRHLLIINRLECL